MMSHEPLRVSLEDLRSADTKGRWWLVGTAWGGDPLVEHKQEAKSQAANAPAPDAAQRERPAEARQEARDEFRYPKEHLRCTHEQRRTSANTILLNHSC